MPDQLSELLRDYQLETRFGKSRHDVTHVVHDPDLPPSAPPLLDRWESHKEVIGSGGQGKVFLQSCTSGGRRDAQRALKIIRCHGDDGKRRYLRELETMVRFSHEKYAKFFVTMLGWYFYGKNLCIAMEYYPKGNLHTYLRERPPLPEEDAQQVIGQVLQGVSIMHRAGFAHRDIKPQNILIQQHPTSEGSEVWWIKLADFGISKRVDTTVTGETQVIGTLEYMAPEHFDRKNGNSDVDYRKADMWAIGAMAFHILTKSRGFLQRRLTCDDILPAEGLIPPDCSVSSTAVAFILEMTMIDSVGRLGWEMAVHQTWVKHCIYPWLTILDTEVKSSASSISSSSGSSLFYEEEELTTLETRPTETLVDITPEKLPGSATVTTFDVIRTPEANQRIEPRAAHDGFDVSILPPAPSRDIQSKQRATEEEVDSRFSDNERCRALYYAASRGDVQAVRRLVNGLINLETAYDGVPHLYTAAYYGQLEVVSLLADLGASVSTPTTEGATPLYAAAAEGHLEVVRLLADLGASITTPYRGFTPLYSAAWAGRVDVVWLLAGLGAKITTASPVGCTPLWGAASQGQLEVVRLLANLGASVTTPNHMGRTPIEAAAINDQWKTVELLESHIPSPTARTGGSKSMIINPAEARDFESSGQYDRSMEADSQDPSPKPIPQVPQDDLGNTVANAPEFQKRSDSLCQTYFPTRSIPDVNTPQPTPQSEYGSKDHTVVAPLAAEQKMVRIVLPPEHIIDKKPRKGILKESRTLYPESAWFPREGVALHKEDRRAKDVPPGARWTKVSRTMINPEALTVGKERFEIRDDFVIILRVLNKDEIHAYAAATQILRERRRRGRPDRRGDPDTAEDHQSY